jgi:hypothetical protein
MPVYGDKRLEAELRGGFKAAGKKLDMGKACLRFRKADDLDLASIGAIIGRIPMDRWVEIAKASRR